MRPGDVIADRFALEALVGAGGMGAVFRAHDRHTDEKVALKVMRERHEGSTVRFFLEARVLADLRHPGIVRYVGHGATVAGEHWMAMEWLEGQSLAERLEGGPLDVSETLTLARRVAEALAVAHGRGVVHRDVKPSNLFLVGGALERLKVLDFGVARLGQTLSQHTGEGRRVGTPRYMAPEQVRGERGVDARADVFALGCVLYFALTGQHAFTGDDEMAVFAKILLEEPAPLAGLRGDLPPGLEQLLGRMLAKDPAGRPSDATAVEQALRELTADTPVAGSSGPLAVADSGEQRLYSIVVAAGAPGAAAARALALRHGGQAELVGDGTLGVALSGGRSALEQATQAARVALGLAPLADGIVAVATGRAQRLGRKLVGEAVERALALLGEAGPGPRVDGVTAALLAGTFELGADGPEAQGRLLLREGDRRDPARTVLGKVTPFVGRERELRTLEACFDECVLDRVARVVLLTSPPGLGKTRLRRELAKRLLARHPDLQLFLGHGDPMRAGSPFSLVAPALRWAAGVRDGEPPEVVERKLVARAAEVVPPAEAERVAEFLAELVGVPMSDRGRVQLRAARGDPQLMGDQLRRAWEDLLAGECARHPVLLVLEDVHYGDLPSIQLVDAALRNIAGPLMILALARPEVHALFPGLWADRALTEIRLGELPPRAGAELVRAVLPELPDEELRGLLERAAGNALYLEELLRARAEGLADRLPETVRAMVQLRVEGFPAEARRLLRAGSVFGEVFWLGGLVALAGEGGDERDLGEWLRVLEDREVLARRLEARFPGEDEWVFRHALVREAAYGMWTEAERARAHRAAGIWLEQRGESDAMLLAAHFERGGEPRRAVTWYRRAAEQALDGNDFAEALHRAGLGIACGAAGGVAASLHLILAQAHVYRGAIHDAVPAARRTLDLASPGDPIWAHALGQLAVAGGKLGDQGLLVELVERLAGRPEGRLTGPLLAAAARLVTALQLLGMPAGGVASLLELTPSERALYDPPILARVDIARSIGVASSGDVAGYLRLTEAAVGACEQAGDLRGALGPRVNLGFALIELGAHEAAVRTLRDTLATARRLGLPAAAGNALLNLGWALARAGALDEALAVEREAVERHREQGSRYVEGAAELYLGRILLELGDPPAALAALRRAAALLEVSAPLRAYARAAVADALLAGDRLDEAVPEALAAAAALEALGEIHEGEAYVRLVHGRALARAGRHAEAGAVMARARARLLERAAQISDRGLRERFLVAVPENHETLGWA